MACTEVQLDRKPLVIEERRLCAVLRVDGEPEVAARHASPPPEAIGLGPDPLADRGYCRTLAESEHREQAANEQLHRHGRHLQYESNEGDLHARTARGPSAHIQ